MNVDNISFNFMGDPSMLAFTMPNIHDIIESILIYTPEKI